MWGWEELPCTWPPPPFHTKRRGNRLLGVNLHVLRWPRHLILPCLCFLQLGSADRGSALVWKWAPPDHKSHLQLLPCQTPPGSHAPHPQRPPCHYPQAACPPAMPSQRATSRRAGLESLVVIMSLGFDPTGKAQLELLSPGTLWPGRATWAGGFVQNPITSPALPAIDF